MHLRRESDASWSSTREASTRSHASHHRRGGPVDRDLVKRVGDLAHPYIDGDLPPCLRARLVVEVDIDFISDELRNVTHTKEVVDVDFWEEDGVLRGGSSFEFEEYRTTETVRQCVTTTEADLWDGGPIEGLRDGDHIRIRLPPDVKADAETRQTGNCPFPPPPPMAFT